ncbi:MAG: hypothetical protein MJ061_01410 [Mailhella sp.]|nr:hypothetical protein [Mailhella sp.]
MKKYLPVIGKLVVAGIFLLACWLLYQKLRMYSLSEIAENITLIIPAQLALSVILVAINYAILVGYDWLAVKAVHRRLPLSRITLVSFTGCAVSYNIGALLGGTAVRYRLYGAWGFKILDIVKLVLMLAVTFWIGALGLAGGVLLFADIHVPPELGISPGHINVPAVICGLAKGRPVKILGRECSLPPLGIALSQTAVACADLVVAALCLYVLLPAEADLPFSDFLSNYLLAQVAVVLTHVPGGVGVLEVILLHIVHGVTPQRLFGAILIFRVLYYLIPLAISAVLLFLYEIRLRRRTPEQIERETASTYLPSHPDAPKLH